MPRPNVSDPDPPAGEARPSPAQEASARAERMHDEAGEAVRRLAERRVRYQEIVIRREIRHAELENEQAAAVEREQARLDAASDTEFMRDQIQPMLDDGWTLEQLEEIGITRDMLASLDLLDDATPRPLTPGDAP